MIGSFGASNGNMRCVSLLATLCDLLGPMYVYLSGQFAYDINDNCVCMGIAPILHSIFKVKQTLQSWLRLRFIQLGIVSRTNHFPAKCAISKQIEKQTNRERWEKRQRERENRKTNLVTTAETVAASRSWSWTGSGSGYGSGSGTVRNGEFSLVRLYRLMIVNQSKFKRRLRVAYV